jgi:hypothetical protein
MWFCRKSRNVPVCEHILTKLHFQKIANNGIDGSYFILVIGTAPDYQFMEENTLKSLDTIPCFPRWMECRVRWARRSATRATVAATPIRWVTPSLIVEIFKILGSFLYQFFGLKDILSLGGFIVGRRIG